MQVATAWRRTAAALLALLIVVVGCSSVEAQDPEIHRFFGFLGDVTIDGEPVGPGSTIVALVDDEVVAETVVNAAGAWILDVDTDVFDGGDCNVTFVVNDLQAETAWDTCTMRVRLALTSADGQTATDSASDASSTEAVADTEPDVSEDEMEEEVEDGELVQSEELVRPRPPLTGTGGVVDESGNTNWLRTAAITGFLTLMAALAALAISRGTDAES